MPSKMRSTPILTLVKPLNITFILTSSNKTIGETCHNLHRHTRDNRFHSFAPPRSGNDAKWFVDGCGYMWAVSVALEEARESIWILDWWLSPGVYLIFENGGQETDEMQNCI
jgi:phosphatidylserine/phosphatidylglycerophosphate/cardiolipin synthase-like enzyme